MSSGILEHDKGISARGIVPWHRSPSWKVYEEAGVLISQVVQECFDWTVTLEQADRLNKQGERVIIPDAFNIVRDDTDQVLGRSGKRYQPLQNADAAQIFADIVDNGDILIDTAGSLWDGRKIFISCQFPSATMTVGGDDRESIETYLILCNAHDGTGALEIAIVPIRVVCANTLSWALGSKLRSFKVRHTATILDRAMQARQALDISFKATQALHDELEQFVQTSITDKDIEKLLDLAIPLPEKEGRGQTMVENTRNSVLAIYNGDRYGQDAIKDTAYGALMAISAYADHEAIFRTTETSSIAENQFRVLTAGNQPLVNAALPFLQERVVKGTSFDAMLRRGKKAATQDPVAA